MSKDILTVDSDTLDTTVNALNKASVFLDDSITSSKNSFSYLQSSPNLSKGINTLHGNMSVMAQRLKGFGNTLNKQNNKIVETENYLDGLIDSIEVPTELANVDTTYQSDRVNMNLSKNDGKSVNPNDTTTEQAISEETDIDKVKLDDINNAGGKEKQELDDEHSRDKEKLEDINNGQGASEVVLDDKHSFDKEEDLKELNDQATNEATLDEGEYDVNKEQINDIDNDTVLSDVEVQFDESNIDKEIVNKEIIVDDNYLTDDDYNETEDILNRLKGE